MKKRLFLLLLSISVITILVCAVVLATSKEDEKILTGEKISSISESYEEIDTEKRTNQNEEQLINIANQCLENINVKTIMDKENNITIQEFDNKADSRKETVITSDNAIVKINSETKELINYINKKDSYKINTLSEEKIKDIGIELFDNIKNLDKENYKINYIEQFDEEIWRIGFAKEYDGLLNCAESINFSYCPETKEIVTLAVNRVKYDNNDIVITEKKAKEIAKKYLEKSSGNDIEIRIDIVRPNYFYSEKNEDESIYKNINRMRKAYVCTFNNEAQSQVYIDCTTGEVIGGNMINGGIY